MPKVTTLSLLGQLLRPFIILLLILACATVIGSGLLLHRSLVDSVDQQLKHAQKMVYQELKQRELTLADILTVLAQKPAEIPVSTLEKEARAYQPLLDIHLFDAQNELSPQLRELTDSVIQSQKSLSHITFDSRKNFYSLSIFQPVAAPRNALLIQFPLNQKLLKVLAGRYKCDLSLFSEEGHLMISNNNHLNQAQMLSEIQLAQITGSNNIYTTMRNNADSRRLLAPLPLGSDGNFYLAASKSLDELNNLLITNSWRLLLTVLLTLALGATIYYRMLLHALTPLKNLLETIHQVAGGNLSSRTETTSDNHLHALSSSFNQMLEQLENLYENRLESEKNSALNQETAKYSIHLKKKSLEIERANIQLKEQFKELTALFQVSRSLTSALDQNLLFEKVFTILRDTLHCDRIVLLLYHPGSESLDVAKTTGIDAVTSKGLSFSLGEGISGLVAASMKPIYSVDLSSDARNLNYKGRWASTGSLLSMPMVLQNRLIGVLNIHHQQVDAFNPVAQQMAQAIADQTAISIENSRLYEKTRTLSATDDLTGLANRRQFQDYLQREWAQSRRYHGNFSLLMLDIDFFKAYNDTHGHLKGDILLKKFSALLLQNTRGIDLVARFGGEEFVILLPKADKEGSLAVAKKLCNCIEAEQFNGMERSQPQKKITASIGTATFPTDSTDIYELLNMADEALYQVKRNGRNNAAVWTRETAQAREEQSPR